MTALYGRFDVVVVGSGSAGSTAAIAAARGGAKVLLVEKLPFLGGVSTAVLDTFYGFYTPGSHSTKVVGGIADDVVAGLRAIGTVVERPNTYGAGTGVTYLAEHLKLVWEDLVIGAGAKVLLHAFVQDATVEDGRITELLMATKAGLQRVEAGIVIDASGDADVCHHAGFGYELAGELSPAQTLTTTFRMTNVDIGSAQSIGKDELHRLMEIGEEVGRLRPPESRRERSHHSHRRHDRHDHDEGRARRDQGWPCDQRHRSGRLDGRRDRRAGVRRSSIPAFSWRGSRVTKTPRWWLSGPRSVSARPGGFTATIGSLGTMFFPPASSMTRSACAGRRSRITTAVPGPARPGSTFPTRPRSGFRSPASS